MDGVSEPTRTVLQIDGLPTASSLRVSPRDLRVPGRALAAETDMRRQLENHARQTATFLVPSSVEVEWTCRVTGVVFAYPMLHGPDVESIQADRKLFEAGAEAAYRQAQHAYGTVRWSTPE